MTKPRRAAAARRPSTTMSATVFKGTCLEVMDDLATRGADVIVTKHGRPVVRVIPAAATPASPLGFLRGTIVRHGDLVSADEALWAPTMSCTCASTCA